MHSGNLIEGDKTGADITPLCQSFTKMGYVTASMNYRLGIENYPTKETAAATRALMRAVQDGRAAVRYFRMSVAANGNPYGIDPSMIFIGGVSVGALAATDVAYLDRMSEFPLWCDTTKHGMSGWANEFNGSSGYSSSVKAVINICGAVSDTSWMHPGGTPIISLQGDNDHTIPFDKGSMLLLNADTTQQVFGSHSIMQHANSIGLVNCFYDFKGQDHMPQVNNTEYLDTTLNLTRNFLIHFVCGDTLQCFYEHPLSVQERNAQSPRLHCYPNPAQSALTVSLDEFGGQAAEISLYNALGLEVRKYNAIRDSQITIGREGLPAGLYLIDVRVRGVRYTSRVVFD
jgi:para-nitrobenzyl esterase